MSLLMFASLGAAQDSTSAQTPLNVESVAARARTHFERGVEHYSDGNYDAALAEFQRSYELSPTYKLLFNLAQVQTERHDYAAALVLYTDYLHDGGEAVTSERASAVRNEVERLEQRSAEVSVDVDVDGARISVNAVQLGTSPLHEAVRVNVGTALVRVEKPGFLPFEQNLSLAGADRRQVSVVLKPLTAAAPPVEAAPRIQTTYNMTPAWIGLGSALVLVGATATFGVLSLNAREQQDGLLATYPGRPSELDAARVRLQTFAALTDGFAAASVVAGVVGLYFLWAPPERREALPPGRAQLRVAATPTGVTLAGVF